MTRSTRHFYIGLYKKSAEVTGFASGFDPSRLITLSQRDTKAYDTSAKKRDPYSSALTFSNVFSSFVSIMETYRKFIPVMLGMAPLLSSMLAERRIGRFAKEKGTLHNLSNDIMEIYELDFSYYRQYVIHRDEVSTAFDGTRHMPDVMIIGLVSAYDAFLSHLLRVIIS